MILQTRHVGLVVRNLERSLLFYRDVLGFEFLKQSIEEGNYIDNVVGIKGVKLEWAKLKAKDGSVIELLQYHSHPQITTEEVIPSNRIGCSHVALTVDDLDKVCSVLKNNNGICNGEPQVSPDGKVRVVYCHDPDGIILELVEEISDQ